MKQFIIRLNDLKKGENKFIYKLTPSFFNHFDYYEWKKAEITIDLTIINQSNVLNILFDGFGWVEVPCDKTGVFFSQNVSPKAELLIKFGKELNVEDDRVWEIPFEEKEINISKFIFEVVVLSFPMKNIAPNYKNHEKENKVQYLYDSRWDALKELKQKLN